MDLCKQQQRKMTIQKKSSANIEKKSNYKISLFQVYSIIEHEQNFRLDMTVKYMILQLQNGNTKLNGSATDLWCQDSPSSPHCKKCKA